MYKIFEKKYSENNGIIRPPEFDLVKRVYEYQIEDIVNYYRDNQKMISNQHLLVRMLNIFTPSLDYDLDIFISLIYTRAPYVAKHFRLTSEIEAGVLFDDLFYMGKNILIYNEDYFNVYETIGKWKEAKAVTVLKHPISSLKFLLPNPLRYPTNESGLSVISINLPMLLVQYREFLRTEALKPDGTRGGAQSFVARYVLPNMMYSHIDRCIFNRFFNNFYGYDNNDDEPIKHPFMVINIDYSKRVDKVSKILLEYMNKKSLPYYSYLKLIPSIYSEDAQEAMLMPESIKTRRNWWALYLARLDEMCFLIDVGERPGVYRNRDLLSKAKIDISRLYRENIYQIALEGDMLSDVYIKMDKILNT